MGDFSSSLEKVRFLRIIPIKMDFYPIIANPLPGIEKGIYGLLLTTGEF
jgi:hypothetical protein